MEVLVLSQHGIDIAIAPYLGMLVDARFQIAQCFLCHFGSTEFDCCPFKRGACKAEIVKAALIDVGHMSRPIGRNLECVFRSKPSNGLSHRHVRCPNVSAREAIVRICPGLNWPVIKAWRSCS